MLKMAKICMATKNVQKSITLNKFGAESDFGIASTIPYSITASNMMACVPTNQTSIELKPRSKKQYFVSKISGSDLLGKKCSSD